MQTTIQRGLAREFAEVLARISYDTLPEEVREAAKMRLLDALSVTLNGKAKGLPAPQVALKSIAGSTGECTVIAEPGSVACADAAFANAVAGHSTLQEDSGGGSHPGTYVVPTAIAVAEERRRSGRELLAALVAGYEAAARVDRIARAAMNERGMRGVPVLGPIATAIVAGKLSGFDESQLTSAVNIAANQSGGIYQGFWEGSMEGYFHAGFAARAGIAAARLAEAGAVTSANTFEGQNGFLRAFAGGSSKTELLTGEIKEYAVMQARSKPFPACAANQDTMLAIGMLFPQGVAEREIERVVLRRPSNSIDIPGVPLEPPYLNMLQAQMSAKFTALAALLGKPVRDLAFYRDSYGDAEVEAVARRTELISEDRPDMFLEVFLRDGRRFETRAGQMAHGNDHGDHLEWDTAKVPEKFARLAAPLLGAKTEAVAQCVARLDAVKDVRELTALLRG